MDELDPLNLDIQQIIKGVGQGLLHVGDLADYLWYLDVEHGWAMHQGIQAAHGILGFFRFRDDMIIFMKGGVNGPGQPYLDGIISRAGAVGYEVKVEKVGDSVSFLNVSVGIDTLRRRYTTQLYTKPTDIHNAPLDPRSAQPWHTHGVWPKAQLKVATRIDGSAVTAAKRMINKFHNHCLPPRASLKMF